MTRMVETGMNETKKANTGIEGIGGEKKFRARTLIITAVLCIAIVALGIYYIRTIIDKTNAEATDNSQAVPVVTSNDGDEGTGKAPAAGEASVTTADSADGAVTAPADVTVTRKETTAPPAPAPKADVGFTASAFADAGGLSVEWSFTDSGFAGSSLTIAMSDGSAEYETVGENIPIAAGKYKSTAANAKNAVSVNVAVTDSSGEVLFRKNIVVANMTYAPETTYLEGIDPGVLIR